MSPVHCCQFFIFSLCVHLFSLFTYFSYYSDIFVTNLQENLLDHYDYIIVGSGTAGSLVAHRIATETNHTFIILEAGGKSNPILEIPVLGPLLHGSIYDWQFETVPQRNACLAMENNVCKLPQGKIIGGSAKLNNMIHVRGNLSHYVDWFQGLHSEEYISRQFEYIENNVLDFNNLLFQSDLTDAMLDAAAELGYKRIGINFEKGFTKAKLSQKQGKRWTTSDKINTYKHIITNCLVEKILILEKRAVGVEIIDKDNVRSKVYARKGVILSAGTYNTPKILQLSGIGPRKLLKKLNLPLVKDLPVGKNLQEHIATGLDLLMFNKSLKLTALDILNPLNAFEYFWGGAGPLTSSGCEVIGFLSTKKLATPDLQFMVLPVGISSDRGSHLRKTLGIRTEVWNNYFVKTFNSYTATILPIALHPKSKGEVYIENKDPKNPPKINPNFLTEKDDIELLTKGLKLVFEFVSTKAMNDIGAYINPIQFPGCENYEFLSEEYCECYIRRLTLTSYHPVGTCSMGRTNSKIAVVDTSFRVIGVENLYVVDGSVLPTLPSGNINAAIAMMANIFYETNIKIDRNIHKTDLHYKCRLLYEYFFEICLMSLRQMCS